MADEQIIYLSPEEELTSVRERLKRIPAKRIILVIPAQTQLRSHVSWRLLHTQARDLNKDILIISTDRQIRSVVKAAGFRVADSLESTPSSRNRPSGRSLGTTGRSNMGGRTASHLKTPPGRSTSGQSRQSGQLRPPQQRLDNPNSSRERSQQFGNRPSQQLNADRGGVLRNDSRSGPTPSTSPASSTFGMEDSQFGPGINYSIPGSAPVIPTSNIPDMPSTPSIHPLEPSYQDEESDLFLEDFQRAQSIREAAQKNDPDRTDRLMSPPPLGAVSPEANASRFVDLPPAGRDRDAEDPLVYLDDDDAVSLPEQRGSIPFDEFDDRGVDITHEINPSLNIEDEGDLGPFARNPGPYPWDEDASFEDSPTSRRVHNIRPRASRTGKIPAIPQPPHIAEAETRENSLPVYDRPTMDIPSSTVRSSGTLGTRDPLPMPLAAPRAVTTKPVQPPLKKRPPNTRRGATGAIPTTSRTTGKSPAVSKQRQSKKQSRGSAGISILVGILIILIIGLVAFLWPSATVAVTLPSHDYTVQTQLLANATTHQNATLKTVPAQTLTFETSVTGTGTATGSTTVGTVQASGNVIFTNNDKNNQVVIPTNTIVATKAGIQFVTQAEALVLPSSTILEPVKAQNAGANGNVPAGSISVIPASSLTAIQQANPSGTTVNLSVTNSDPTTNGGAGSATSLTTKDVKTEQATLDLQLQKQITNFLAKYVQVGDQTGKPVRQETPVTAPAVGSVVTNGSFTETLHLSMTILVVRAADLQTAAASQLQNALTKAKSSLSLVPQQPIQLTQLKNTSPVDGSAVRLSFVAVGQVAAQISEEIVRSLVYGKSVADAQQALVGKNGIPNVLHVQINVSPSFFHWVPFWTQRIDVHFNTVHQAPPAPPKIKHR